jgi:hypothetical protein
MNGNQDTIPSKDVPWPSSPGLGWDEFLRELVGFFASIKLAMFPFKRMGVLETFIIDQQGVICEMVIGPRDWTRLDSLQVPTKMLNVTPKAADAQQSDRGARKG